MPIIPGWDSGTGLRARRQAGTPAPPDLSMGTVARPTQESVRRPRRASAISAVNDHSWAQDTMFCPFPSLPKRGHVWQESASLPRCGLNALHGLDSDFEFFVGRDHDHLNQRLGRLDLGGAPGLIAFLIHGDSQ
jgi:hypothetical protein